MGCPTCSGDSIEYSSITIAAGQDGAEAWQEAACNDCETEWEDVYKFSHARIIQKGEVVNAAVHRDTVSKD
jgi:hypothetical protein